MSTKTKIKMWKKAFEKAKKDKKLANYCLRYADENNPFLNEAIRELKSTDIKMILNLIPDPAPVFSKELLLARHEYKKCWTQKAYEEYFIKHRSDNFNPYLLNVKHEINIRNRWPIWRRIIVFIGVLLLIAAILSLGFSSGDFSFIFLCVTIAIAFLALDIMFIISPAFFYSSKFLKKCIN